MARFSPCLQCAEMIIQWAEKNRINMMIFGFETMNSEFDINQINSQIPTNLMLFNVSKKEMVRKEERKLNMNETFTKETFQELLQRIDGGFQGSNEKQKVLKPIIKSRKYFGVKVNNFVKERMLSAQDIEKEKLIIENLLRMRKSRDDILSTESSELSTPVGSGHKRHKQLKPMM